MLVFCVFSILSLTFCVRIISFAVNLISNQILIEFVFSSHKNLIVSHFLWDLSSKLFYISYVLCVYVRHIDIYNSWPPVECLSDCVFIATRVYLPLIYRCNSDMCYSQPIWRNITSGLKLLSNCALGFVKNTVWAPVQSHNWWW